MILQLNPPLPLGTPRGPGLAHLVIDYGPEFQTLWVVLLDNTEVWTFKNADVRGVTNVTMGRPGPKAPEALFRGKPISQLTAAEAQEFHDAIMGNP